LILTFYSDRIFGKLLKLAGGILNNTDKKISSFKLSNFIKDKVLIKLNRRIKKTENLNAPSLQLNSDDDQTSISSLLPHDSNEL